MDIIIMPVDEEVVITMVVAVVNMTQPVVPEV
jgi:hypothetical protein